MDINKLDTVSEDEGVEVHFKNAAGEPMYDGEKPVTARVVGTYSKRYRTAQRTLRDQTAKQARRGKSFDGDQLEENQYVLEAACITEWSLTSGGLPFPITPANWRAVIAKQPQWEEQVAEAMTDHEGFFSKS